MSRYLLLTVRLHERRCHGAGDWPPAPARLFQALVAGAARGATVPSCAAALFGWLEGLPPPEICAPRSRRGRHVTAYVPNNDLDAVGGDPGRVEKTRVGKAIQPWLIDQAPQLMYAWRVDEGCSDPPDIGAIRAVADRLYQFGRGIDMAWAHAELLSGDDASRRFSDFDGVIYRATNGSGGLRLECPTVGSFESLELQYRGNLERLSVVSLGRKAQVLFCRAPKPRFAPVSYSAPPARLLFELRTDASDLPFARFPLCRAVELTALLRDGVIERLTRALPPDRAAAVERALRNRDAPVIGAARVRLLPLASIGHQHADRSIRRLLVEVPGDCPLTSSDVEWAFSGMVVKDHVDPATGEVLQETRLVRSTDRGILRHYGIVSDARGHARWRTVTPAALPVLAARRRIDPRSRREEAKGGSEFASEHAAARRAVIEAVRHAQLDTKVVQIGVQREPFEARGARAEEFAAGTRFDKTRMWHVDLQFDRLMSGPIVIGDGRYTGLGVMAPAPVDSPSVYVFGVVAGLSPDARASSVARTLRRAVLARVQMAWAGNRPLPRWFTGHEPDGSPSRSNHAHLFFQADLRGRRLLVVAPHRFRDDDPSAGERSFLAALEEALQHFDTLNAGAGGRLVLRREPVDAAGDPLFRPARTWLGVTPYVPTRYPKRRPFTQAVAADAVAELRRRNLPRGEVDVLELKEGARGAVTATLRLAFAVPVRGPIALGRTSHLGGGLFSGETS